MEIITAIVSLIILIGFFYLVNMVSHIRNILRVQTYWMLGDKQLSDDAVKSLRVQGVITKKMENALKQGIDNKS